MTCKTCNYEFKHKQDKRMNTEIQFSFEGMKAGEAYCRKCYITLLENWEEENEN